MIYKSYLVENNIEILKNNLILFYGENFGLKEDFKNIIKEKNYKIIIKNLYQDDIIKNKELIYNEILNGSLFDENKIFFFNNCNDKILDFLKEIEKNLNLNKIFIFSEILDKKSKLRNYFEKSKNCDVIACYEDSDINIKKFLQIKLKDFSGVTTQTLNIFLESCGLDRIKLNNELQKVNNYFLDKIIKNEDLAKLINPRNDDNFKNLKDSALNGQNKNTNKLLSTTMLDVEKIPLYLHSLNQNLIKIKELIHLSKGSNLNNAIDKIKPPVFWKEKPNILSQAKLWNIEKIKEGLQKIYDVEVKSKSNIVINKNILFKKLILDICLLANS